jgi:hypothetical protein
MSQHLRKNRLEKSKEELAKLAKPFEGRVVVDGFIAPKSL